MLREDTAWALLKRYSEPLREAEWVHSDFQRYRGWTDAALEVVDLILLGSHWETAGPLPPVRVALSRMHSYETTDCEQSPWLPLSCAVALDPIVEPLALRTILRAALAQPTVAWAAASTQIDLVVEYRIDDDHHITHESMELLVRAWSATALVSLTIGRLALQLAPHDPPGQRNHARAHETRPCTWQYLADATFHGRCPARPHCDANGVQPDGLSARGAALSAVATASPPIAAVRCSGLFYAARPEHKAAAARVAGLQAVLPLLVNFVATAVTIAALERRDDERAYVTQLLARGTPLRDVVGDTLRLRLDGDDDEVARLHVDCLRLGSTVRLQRGTRLFFELIRVNVGAETVAAQADGEEELDLVAHVLDGGGFVAVVFAGYGLVWATTASAVMWQCLNDDTDVAMAEGDASSLESSAAALASLTLRFEGTVENLSLAVMPSALRISPALPLLARGTLEALAIDRVVVTRDDLTHLVGSSPRLASLSLDRCVVETLEPLMEAYRRGQSCLAAVSLLGVSDFRFRQELVERRSFGKLKARREDGDAPEWLASLVDSLTSGTTRGVLRELHVDIRAMPFATNERGLLEQLAQAIGTSTLAVTRRVAVIYAMNAWRSLVYYETRC